MEFVPTELDARELASPLSDECRLGAGSPGFLNFLQSKNSRYSFLIVALVLSDLLLDLFLLFGLALAAEETEVLDLDLDLERLLSSEPLEDEDDEDDEIRLLFLLLPDLDLFETTETDLIGESPLSITNDASLSSSGGRGGRFS